MQHLEISSELLQDLWVGCDGMLSKWADTLATTRDQLSDAIAIHIANRFDTGLLSFDDADYFINNLHSVWLSETDDISADWLPRLAASVYLAFDAGEYTRAGDGGADPVQKYTVPEIKRILREL